MTFVRTASRTGSLLALAAAGGVVLAACSSTPVATRATSTTTTTSAPATTTSPPSTTTTAPGAPACSTASLQLAEDPAKSTAGAGSADIAYTLTNSGSTPCLLDGFPTVTFYGPSGASGAGAGPELSLTTQQTGSSPSPVILDAGGVGAFYLVVGNVPANGASCTAVASIEVAPPGGKEVLSVPASLEPCGPSVGVTAIEPLASLST